jgi:hypothetical protein
MKMNIAGGAEKPAGVAQRNVVKWAPEQGLVNSLWGPGDNLFLLISG